MHNKPLYDLKQAYKNLSEPNFLIKKESYRKLMKQFWEIIRTKAENID